MEEETWSRRGWSGRCIVKSVIAEGVQFSYVIIFGGGEEGKVLIPHTFLKTPASPWDVINDRSLNSVE